MTRTKGKRRIEGGRPEFEAGKRSAMRSLGSNAMLGETRKRGDP